MPRLLGFEKPIASLEKQLETLVAHTSSSSDLDLDPEIRALRKKIDVARTGLVASLDPLDRARLAHHPDRPTAHDYIRDIFTDVIEIKGDRTETDDDAIFCGFATIDDVKCVIVAQEKGQGGNNAKSAAFRKALRAARLAEKFRLPLVTLVDTADDLPNMGAEPIAQNIRAFTSLETPILSVVIGEGGTSTALAIGIADRTLMLENAYYPSAVPHTAQELFARGFIDGIVPEPPGGAHLDVSSAGAALSESILLALHELAEISLDILLATRGKK